MADRQATKEAIYDFDAELKYFLSRVEKSERIELANNTIFLTK
jgi:hypothetical protein